MKKYFFSILAAASLFILGLMKDEFRHTFYALPVIVIFLISGMLAFVYFLMEVENAKP